MVISFEEFCNEIHSKGFSMCGRMPKLNKYGEPYGWNSTVFWN